VKDIKGNNDGTTSGTITTGAVGKINEAFDFDGVDDYVEVPDDSSLRPSEITCSLWVKGNFRGDWNGLLYKLDSAEDNGYGIMEEGDVDEFRLGVRSGGVETVVRHIPITSSEWHHIAMTYDGTTLTVYKDGASVGTNTGDLTHTTDRLLIGTRDGNYFDGIIDEICVYNRALSGFEIRRLYRETRSNKLGRGFPGWP